MKTGDEQATSDALDMADVHDAIVRAREAGCRFVTIRVGESEVEVEIGACMPAPVVPDAPEAPAAATEPTPTERTVNITSPKVGRFRPCDPALAVGDAVKQDQIVGEIVALGVAQDVFSNHAGEVTEITVETDEMVDFGRSLYRIKVDA